MTNEGLAATVAGSRLWPPHQGRSIVPGTRRVFAGVCGSPGSVPALCQAAGLARHHGGRRTSVLLDTVCVHLR
jgi:hypothetical protein